MLEPRLARLVLPRLDLISTHLTRFPRGAVSGIREAQSSRADVGPAARGADRLTPRGGMQE